MNVASDWRRVTKALLGGSLIAAPLLIAIGELVSSAVYSGDDAARYLASIEDNSAAHYAGNLLGAVGAVFLIGAVIALTHLVRSRHPRFGLAVGGFALFCVAMLPGAWLFSTVTEYQMATSADQAAMARLLDESEESAAVIPFFVVWIGMTVSIVLLAIGLAWSRTVPRWMPALLGVAIVLLFVGDSGVAGALATIAMLAALGSIGAAVLRSDVDAWEAGDLTAHEPLSTPPGTAIAR